MAERRHQAALHQFHPARAGQPSRIARPGEFGGAEAERTHHRLQPLLDDAAHAGVGTDPRQDNQLAARPQHAREFVERCFRIWHRGDDILRHHDVERIVGKFELLGVHYGESLDILEAELGDARLRLAQHGFRDIGPEDAQMRRV